MTGLLSLLLLTDARRDARVSPAGDLVLLADQDRSRWDRAKIAEGEALLAQALRDRRPGPTSCRPRSPACHSGARCAADTDWTEIAALYGELLATSRRRWWPRTGRPRWPWPRARRPGWTCSTRPPRTGG